MPDQLEADALSLRGSKDRFFQTKPSVAEIEFSFAITDRVEDAFACQERGDKGGNVEILGKDITGLSENALNEVRKKFGILFQSGALFNSMTVAENAVTAATCSADQFTPNAVMRATAATTTACKRPG